MEKQKFRRSLFVNEVSNTCPLMNGSGMVSENQRNMFKVEEIAKLLNVIK